MAAEPENDSEWLERLKNLFGDEVQDTAEGALTRQSAAVP